MKENKKWEYFKKKTKNLKDDHNEIIMIKEELIGNYPFR